MSDIKMIDGVAYVRSTVQPKNKVQALQTSTYWSHPSVTKDICTGKTTANCLKFIASAMHNPNEPQSFVTLVREDHGIDYVQPYVYDMVEKLIKDMGLKFLIIDKARKTLTYDIYYN